MISVCKIVGLSGSCDICVCEVEGYEVSRLIGSLFVFVVVL